MSDQVGKQNVGFLMMQLNHVMILYYTQSINRLLGSQIKVYPGYNLSSLDILMYGINTMMKILHLFLLIPVGAYGMARNNVHMCVCVCVCVCVYVCVCVCVCEHMCMHVYRTQ